MQDFPTTPLVADAPPDLFESGHLWILEDIDGAPLRVQVNESGSLTFGDAQRISRTAEDFPAPYAHAIRHVRERLDRQALRAAVADLTDVVFFGVATHRQTIDYDWARMPSFLGTDVWTAGDGYRRPDAVDGIFDRLGLHPVTVVEREVRARDLDPTDYTVPDSAWYDGPAAGVVFRNKAGGRARLQSGVTGGSTGVDIEVDSPAGVAERYVTEDRLERIAEAVADRGRSVTVDSLLDRVVEDVAREIPDVLYGGGDFEMKAFRSAVAARAESYLADRSTE